MTTSKSYKIIVGPRDDEIFTAESFLTYLRLSNQQWSVDSNESRNCSWVFRGQSNANWNLVPKAARPLECNPFKDFLKKVEKDGNQPVKPSDTTDEQYLAAKLCFAVNQALIEFKQLAEDLLLAKNLEKPWNYDLKAFVENAGKANFKMHGPSALAQHHGIPTFLLDWTKRPEIAAFFASSESQNDCGIAVFALRRTQHPLMLKGGQEQVYHFVEESPAENAFLHAQRGIFTTHLEPYHFMKTGEYEPLEKKIIRAENTYSEILLKKIILQKAEVPRLAMLLSREEFTQAHLMPTLDNVAKTVMSRLQIK